MRFAQPMGYDGGRAKIMGGLVRSADLVLSTKLMANADGQGEVAGQRPSRASPRHSV